LGGKDRIPGEIKSLVGGKEKKFQVIGTGARSRDKGRKGKGEGPILQEGFSDFVSTSPFEREKRITVPNKEKRGKAGCPSEKSVCTGG